jgi:hypothetical protein
MLAQFDHLVQAEDGFTPHPAIGAIRAYLQDIGNIIRKRNIGGNGLLQFLKKSELNGVFNTGFCH